MGDLHGGALQIEVAPQGATDVGDGQRVQRGGARRRGEVGGGLGVQGMTGSVLRVAGIASGRAGSATLVGGKGWGGGPQSATRWRSSVRASSSGLPGAALNAIIRAPSDSGRWSIW